MKDIYFIMDTKTSRFFMYDTSYIPWILHAFTDDFRNAHVYDSENAAKVACEKFSSTKTEFDGNTPLAENRLAVVKLEFKKV